MARRATPEMVTASLPAPNSMIPSALLSISPETSSSPIPPMTHSCGEHRHVAIHSWRKLNPAEHHSNRRRHAHKTCDADPNLAAATAAPRRALISALRPAYSRRRRRHLHCGYVDSAIAKSSATAASFNRRRTIGVSGFAETADRHERSTR